MQVEVKVNTLLKTLLKEVIQKDMMKKRNIKNRKMRGQE